MISGASDEELDIAIARADVLLELQPKIDELKKENQKYKEVIDKAIELLGDYKHYSTPDEKQTVIMKIWLIRLLMF